MQLRLDLKALEMNKLTDLVRENIKSLKPYSSARDEYTGRAGVFLDANENPFGDLNRYPDPYQRELKNKLSAIKNVPAENIFIGNGSDEVIDLAYRIFCEPGIDKAVTFIPTYGMYAVSAEVNGVELIELPLDEDFQPAADQLFGADIDKAKLLFLCTPNNPTANSFATNKVREIIRGFEGIIIIDEAYIDFSEAESWLTRLAEFPNLIVMQTFSKAWGLAAARLGVAYASRQIIDLFNKVKPPYNISKPNQDAALKALAGRDEVLHNIATILQQREWLHEALLNCDLVGKIYPSDANFLLVEVENADKIYEALIDAKVIVRNRHGLVRNCLRITVGSEEENKKLIAALNDIKL
jgi:histidinol-phosphate aminotransferase